CFSQQLNPQTKSFLTDTLEKPKRATFRQYAFLKDYILFHMKRGSCLTCGHNGKAIRLNKEAVKT
ncbi:MAG: hypothetical protein RMK50_02820, partial [Nitrososphaerota archaeon]|nr:hypothetical protein [Candidatus Bathyarchaeota archaeon]MDW8193742.1 hypothetical protein [Nitrososphaerota archaeon]